MKFDYTRYYRTWHPDTPEHRLAMIAFNRRILAPHLPADLGAPMVDVGCGGGFAMLALRELGYRTVTGIDADEGQVATCRSRGLAVEMATDTAGWLRSRAGAFQVILLLDVLEHVPVAEQLDFVSALAGGAGGGRALDLFSAERKCGAGRTLALQRLDTSIELHRAQSGFSAVQRRIRRDHGLGT